MKTAFIGLIALAMLGGCSKSDSTPDKNQDYATLIQGHWEITNETMTVYDVDNQVLKTMPVQEGLGLKWELQDGTLMASDKNGEQHIGAYQLNTKVDPPTIEIKESDDEEEPESTLLKISSLNQTNMVLEQSHDISGFPDTDELVGADHTVLVIELTRE